MGNNKFKLSNMIPNSLLYKLKHLTKPPSSKPPPLTTTINSNKFTITPHMTSPSTVAPPPPCGSRKSYHFTRDLPPSAPGDPPLISPPTQKAKVKKPTKKNRTGTQTRFDSVQPGSILSQNGSGKPGSSFDIVINVDEWIKGVDFQLPRIATKPDKPVQPVGPVKSPAFGVRLRLNSPKIMGIKQGQNGKDTCRKSVGKKRGSSTSTSISQSLAVVKRSDDPKKDFKESMVEMIVENNLKGSKDLEDLLACYLSLNSDEYHHVIIQVFKQIWCDLSGINK